MNYERAWEEYRKVKDEVFPTGLNPVNLPGGAAIGKLEKLERLERHLRYHIIVDANDTKVLASLETQVELISPTEASPISIRPNTQHFTIQKS